MASFSTAVSRMHDALLRTMGIAVIYTPNSVGAAYVVTALLHEPTAQDDNAVASFLTMFARLSDFYATPKKGDEVTIMSTTYMVFEVSTDLQGGVLLALQRA